jgi:hypothetical protein
MPPGPHHRVPCPKTRYLSRACALCCSCFSSPSLRLSRNPDPNVRTSCPKPYCSPAMPTSKHWTATDSIYAFQKIVKPSLTSKTLSILGTVTRLPSSATMPISLDGNQLQPDACCAQAFWPICTLAAAEAPSKPRKLIPLFPTCQMITNMVTFGAPVSTPLPARARLLSPHSTTTHTHSTPFP